MRHGRVSNKSFEVRLKGTNKSDIEEKDKKVRKKRKRYEMSINKGVAAH